MFGKWVERSGPRKTMRALKFPGGVPHAGFIRPMLRLADGDADPDAARSQPAGLLESPMFTARTDDDLTLLLARLTEEPLASAGD